MTFLHKLSRRLALAYRAVAVAAAVTGCEKIATVASPTGPAGPATLRVAPRAVALLPSQAATFTAVGFTATGDTVAPLTVAWAASGGTITDTSTVGGQHYGQYRAGTQPGSYRVIASAGSVADTATIAVNPVPVARVVVTPAASTLAVGQTVQLTATPEDSTGAALAGRTVSWASGAPGVATVSGTGLVTGVAAGSATITATSEGQSGTATVTVTTVPVASVTVSPATASIQVGQTVQLTATPRDASGNPLSGRAIAWASSAPGVATVSGTGLVTGVAAGSATITATSEGQSGTATVTVTTVPVASVTVSPATASIQVGQTVQLTATPRDASGNPLSGRAIAWASSAPGVATVSGTGLVTGVAAGSATITATSEGQSGTATVTVTAPLPPPSGGAWPNEPAGWTVLTDYDMHALNDGGWTNVYPADIASGQVKVVTDATGPVNPTAWQFYYRAGNTSLCGAAPATEYYSFGATKQLYYAFWIKFSNPFSFPGDNEVHVVVSFTASGNGSGIVFDMSGAGDVYFVNEFAGNGGNSNIYASRSPSWSLGGWHQVELLFDYAGTVRAWVDGVLTVNATGVRYPSDAGFTQVEISPTWGGCAGGAPAFDSWIWYNHVRVSRP